MKRIIVFSTGLLIVLLAPSALASTRAFQGDVNGGGSVSIETKFKHHTTKTMGPVDVDGVPLECDDGGHLTNGVLNRKAKVHKHSRKATLTRHFQNGETLTLTAKFNKDGTRASGTLRDSGDLGGSFGHCDTGTLHWSASRVV